MVWHPPKSYDDPPRLTPRVRKIVSRGTLFIVGLLLLYVGYKCFDVGIAANEEARKLQPVVRPGQRRLTGAFLPLIVGIGLLLLGTVTTVASMAPITWLERLKPKPPITGDRSALETKSHRAWWPW